MGTRCDFYVGRGKDAEWIGSYPFDGYPNYGFPARNGLLDIEDEQTWRTKVAAALADNPGKATTPDMGWPWPWDDSATTDFAYAFDGGKVWCSCFGNEWHDPLHEYTDEEWGSLAKKAAVFPNMSARKNVTFGPRSGLLVVNLPNA